MASFVFLLLAVSAMDKGNKDPELSEDNKAEESGKEVSEESGYRELLGFLGEASPNRKAEVARVGISCRIFRLRHFFFRHFYDNLTKTVGQFFNGFFFFLWGSRLEKNFVVRQFVWIWKKKNVTWGEEREEKNGNFTSSRWRR